ncbi:Glutamine-rich protein 2, partial [Pseudolycoriella hygida]
PQQIPQPQQISQPQQIPQSMQSHQEQQMIFTSQNQQMLPTQQPIPSNFIQPNSMNSPQLIPQQVMQASMPQQVMQTSAPQQVIQNTAAQQVIQSSTPQQVMQNVTSQQQIMQNVTSQQQMMQNATSQQHMMQNATSQPQVMQKATSQPQVMQNATTQQQVTQNATSQQQIMQNATSQQQMMQNAASQQQMMQNTTSQQQVMQNATSQQQVMQNATSQQQMVQNATSQQQVMQNAASQQQVMQNAASQQQVMQNAAAQQQVMQNAASQQQVMQNAASQHQMMQNATTQQQVMQNATTPQQVMQNATSQHQAVQNVATQQQVMQSATSQQQGMQNAAPQQVMQNSTQVSSSIPIQQKLQSQPTSLSSSPNPNNVTKTPSAKSKSRRSNKSSERVPKLVVMSVQNGTLVDCSMDNKLKTITFKFDISDVNPVEVANDLISKDLLSESQSVVFADMVRDIVRQLKLNPNQIPIPTASRRNMDKVRHASLTRQRSPFKTHQRHRSRDEMSTLTQMFDPTIYSLQPLVTPVTVPSQTSSTTSVASNAQHSDHDPSPSSEGHSYSSSLKDIVVVGDAEQQKPIQSDGNYEELDTISRKTSTTSEYTSLSDYTPENTVTRESSVTTSTLRNDITADECNENCDALTTGQFVRSDDSCVIEMTDRTASKAQETVPPPFNENVRSPDLEVPPTQRARKISRFLVTPSVVSVDNESERNIDEAQHEVLKSETVYDGQLQQQQQSYNEDGTMVNVQPIAQFDPSQQQMILSQNNQQPVLGYSGDMIDANQMTDLRNQTIEQFNAAVSNKPLGPESINTLEQLKIGLENITHAHVQTKPKDAQPTVSDFVKSGGQVSDEQIAPTVESPMTYADVAAGSTVQIMNEITGQQFEPVGDIYVQQHPTVQQIQSPQGVPLVTQQPSNVGAIVQTADQVPPPSGDTLSQTTSLYNSRRTSAELALIEQYSKATNDAVTLDNVESAETLRKLSQQGSVDKIEIAPQQPQNTLAALQLKLAQLTFSQQPGQPEQPIYYQQTDEQNQQPYVVPSQDPTETSHVKHEFHQSQLNSPTVQIDISQMKPTSTQSSSAVSTPVIEQNEAVFPQTSDSSNVSATVVQPKQLSDLEQELAKIHQKRYNKDQQGPQSTPPIEQLLPNNATNNAPNIQVMLPNASQSSHPEQVPSNMSVNISIPGASTDSNDSALHVQQQQTARKISRFQVSVVNEATPSIQVQPQDSVRTQFLQNNTTTSLVSSNNATVDEQRYDYGGMNYSNYPNSAIGNELTDQFVEQTSREQYNREEYYRSVNNIGDQNQVTTPKTQKPLERNASATNVGTQKAATGAKEKTRKKSNTMGVRTRSLSQNLQQIFHPFQRGAGAILRSSTQSVASIDKEHSLNKFNSNYKNSLYANAQQNEASTAPSPLPLQRSATQPTEPNKLSRVFRSKSISSPYVPKHSYARTPAELNKELLSKAIAENRFLVQSIQKRHHINHQSKDMTLQPIYQNNEVGSKQRGRPKWTKPKILRPFFSRQNSIEEHHSTSNSQDYSRSFDNLSNESPSTNKSRKKYSKTKSSLQVGKPSNLSLPFGGSCSNLLFSQQKNQNDQSAYQTIHGVSALPTQQMRPTIFKFVQSVKQTNDYSNSDTFDDYDDGSLSDTSSSDVSFDMNSPTVPLKQSSSLSSVPNIQRKPFYSKRTDRFTRMQSLDFTQSIQSQLHAPMINPNVKKTSRTVPHSRTGSPASSPLHSRPVTPTYFDLETRHPPSQQFFKSINQHSFNVSAMTSYGCYQPTNVTIPTINLPKKSSSMSTMVAATPKILNSCTSLSNIVWQNSPSDFKHNLEYARNIIGTMQLEPKSRQQLQLLLQRQHLEEEELRLRHYMELEKFQKNLDLTNQSSSALPQQHHPWMENMSAASSVAPTLQTSQPQMQYSIQNRPQQGTIVVQQSQQQIIQQPTLSSTTPFQLNSTTMPTTTTTYSPSFNSFPSYMETQQIDSGQTLQQLQTVDNSNQVVP